VRARRLDERADLVQEAREFVAAVDPLLGVRAAVVFGSVARGDFNDESDIDVLVVAERLPPRYADRLRAIGWPTAGRIEPIAWTPNEYARHRGEGNLIAVEAEQMGVWLVGAPGTAGCQDEQALASRRGGVQAQPAAAERQRAQLTRLPSGS